MAGVQRRYYDAEGMESSNPYFSKSRERMEEDDELEPFGAGWFLWYMEAEEE